MEWVFLLICASAILMGLGLRIPLKIFFKRRSLGIPLGKFSSITEVKAETRFPRSLFRMIGSSGGPTPLNAPLSEKNCYLYEIVFVPTDESRKSRVTLHRSEKEFTFFSPKGAVTLNPKDFTVDTKEALTIKRWTRFPLPLNLREKIQALELGEGSIEERILPAFAPLQLIGRANQINPQSFRLKKGPGIFPMITAENELVTRVVNAGTVEMTWKDTLILLFFLSTGILGLYLARIIVL